MIMDIVTTLTFPSNKSRLAMRDALKQWQQAYTEHRSSLIEAAYCEAIHALREEQQDGTEIDARVVVDPATGETIEIILRDDDTKHGWATYGQKHLLFPVLSQGIDPRHIEAEINARREEAA